MKNSETNFKQTDIGLIPEDWEVRRFGDIAEFKNGINFTSDQKGKIGILTIDVLNMYGVGYAITFDKLYRINKEVNESYLLRAGDLLFVRSSLKREGVGWTALFIHNDEPTTYCGFIIRARITELNFSKIFLTYFFRSDVARSRLISSSAKLGITNINQGNLSNVTVLHPPLPEQKKIAHILSKIQEAIEKQEQLIITTQELKKALMQKLFTEGLNGEPQKQTEIGPIPESWEAVTFKEIAGLQGGFGFKSTDKVLASNTQLIRMGNLYQNLLQLDRSPVFYPDSFIQDYPEYVLNENDLIISLTGTMGKEDYGFVVKIPKILNRKLLLNQRVARIFLSGKFNLDLNYFYYFLLSRKFLDKLYRTAKGTKQANLSVKEIYNLKVACPSYKEQQKIGSIFEYIDKKLSFTSAILSQYKMFFNSSLNKLMTGQIRVKDIEFELEELKYH